MHKRDHHYYVYIIASRTHVLYTGITNNIARRTDQHTSAAFPGFTAAYKCHRLVWFEHYQYVLNAISREKKIKLIEQTNPTWCDLSEQWAEQTADLSTTLRSGRDDKG